jgi:hypothetical protein
MIEAVLDKAAATAIRLEWGGAANAEPSRIGRGSAASFVPRISLARPWGARISTAAPADAAFDLPAREKAAFTLRLDPVRHARLKQACAATQRSAQQVVTQALDAFLAAKSGPVRAAGAAIRFGEF